MPPRTTAALAAAVLLGTLTGPVPTAGAADLPLAGRVVAVDPGHQLGNSRHPRQVNRPVWVGHWKPCNTTGTATAGGFPEATLNWRVARRLQQRLEALGATVRLTRSTNSLRDWGPCVDERGRFGARVGADLLVSVHGDGAAPGTRGFFVIQPGRAEAVDRAVVAPSRVLARRVRAGLVGVGVPVSTAHGGDGLDTRSDLGTLSLSRVPAVLVELGNMRNRADARCMTSARCRDRYARGLAAGVHGYLAPRPAGR